ncbi:MAG: hypothetical protein LBU65_02465, partial [Planctomycetaceae bacterium]|nr:hypothetical protein [Planctomycetaceae bacterium]
GNAGTTDTADRTKVKPKKNDAITSEVISETNNEPPIGEVLQNMKSLDELPTDLQEAFEQLKVAILNHKVTNFKEVDPQRIIHFLTTMKQIVLSSD